MESGRMPHRLYSSCPGVIGTVLVVCCGIAWTTMPGAAIPALHGEITVFAAASLTDAFQEMAVRFERAYPGVKMRLHFAGSATLRTQLAQGARADVFAAADEPTMQGALRDGSVVGVPWIFARNRLVVVVPAVDHGAIATLQDLARPGIKLVLAHPGVPVGNYARVALAQMSQGSAWGDDFVRRVLANVVSNEMNVKQVVAKVQLREADAGIVYATDVTPSARGALRAIEIPREFNVTARYPLAVVKGARHEAGARAFIDYVLSPAGQAMLACYGFIVADS
jgi:molybdate transport system substrate-binding protein